MRGARSLLAIGVALALAATTAGCAADSQADAGIRIVASTNVYGDLAASDRRRPRRPSPRSSTTPAKTRTSTRPTPARSSRSRGPTSWFATAAATTTSSTPCSTPSTTDPQLIDAVELSGFDASAPRLQRARLVRLPDRRAGRRRARRPRFATTDPAHGEVYAENAAAAASGPGSARGPHRRCSPSTWTGTGVAITEPVPLYLLESIGLVNRTPAAFSEAIEDDTDVRARRRCARRVALFTEGAVALLVYNPQTGGTPDGCRARGRGAGRHPCGRGPRAHPDRARLPRMAEPTRRRAGRGPGAGPMSDVPVLSLRDAELTVGGRVLWSGLDLDVAPGEFVAVLGSNGSGKTSLLQGDPRAVRLEPRRGPLPRRTASPRRPSHRLRPAAPARRRHGAACAVATSSRSASTGTAGASGCRRGSTGSASTSCSRPSARRHYARVPVTALSGGEQQRLRVGQALAGDPRLLLCDEPLSSLDLHAQHVVTDLIDRHRRERGFGVLFVTHDVNPILDRVDRVLYLAGQHFRSARPTRCCARRC